jgi:hypothetical protein
LVKSLPRNCGFSTVAFLLISSESLQNRIGSSRTCTLDIAGTPVPLLEGGAAFVPAGVEHRFSGYEQLSLLVIFERRRPG